jgi:hypothetical protein
MKVAKVSMGVGIQREVVTLVNPLYLLQDMSSFVLRKNPSVGLGQSCRAYEHQEGHAPQQRTAARSRSSTAVYTLRTQTTKTCQLYMPI